jgi:hypothetical protein
LHEEEIEIHVLAESQQSALHTLVVGEVGCEGEIVGRHDLGEGVGEDRKMGRKEQAYREKEQFDQTASPEDTWVPESSLHSEQHNDPRNMNLSLQSGQWRSSSRP